MGMDAGPYCIENDAHGRSHGATSSGVAPHDIQQRPPSYFEVIGFFDPPPSYNDIQGTGQHPVKIIHYSKIQFKDKLSTIK